jgi:hypothetical protein
MFCHPLLPDSCGRCYNRLLPELIHFSSSDRSSLKGFLKDVGDSDFRRHFLELMVLYSLL